MNKNKYTFIVLVVFILSSCGDGFFDNNIIKINGLIWQDDSNAKTNIQNWSSALTYCNNLSLGGYSDWYLPNKKQLQDLYVNKHKLSNITSILYWSSSIVDGDSSYAWLVHFSSGRMYGYTKTNSNFVRCVRGRQ